ncbi:hypothetical protein LAZ67_2000954, partial [Cordylochernes scorpioides]
MTIHPDDTRTYRACNNCPGVELTPTHIFSCPAMAAALQKIDMDPEQQLNTPKMVDIAAAVLELLTPMYPLCYLFLVMSQLLKKHKDLVERTMMNNDNSENLNSKPRWESPLYCEQLSQPALCMWPRYERYPSHTYSVQEDLPEDSLQDETEDSFTEQVPSAPLETPAGQEIGQGLISPTRLLDPGPVQPGLHSLKTELQLTKPTYLHNGVDVSDNLQPSQAILRETHIWITNPYPRPLKIMKNQTLAFGSSPAKINVNREREVEENEEPRFQINENLSPKEQKELKQVLERYGDLFSSRLGRTNLAKHRIDTEDAKPIKHKPYRVSVKERDIIKEQIDEMLTEGIIRPSSSPWSFPVILVKKRDGKYRFCVDYRKLNNVTVKDVYPIPRIDEVMDTLQGSRYFSAIDLRSGYWQVEVEERDKEKTAFTTAHGLYEFNVMPFGLCNAPATFERNMENMLGNLRWQICLCYLDDVIIYSPDFPTHLKRLEAVFRCFRESNLSRFVFEELEILGYITSKHGIKPAEHNIKAIRNFPRPTKVKEVQSFLGMCSYYRKFIKDFSKIADPLTNLIKKSVSFTWTERQEEAFQTLKTALLSPPILGHFNPNAPTYIHTDASNIGIGATLVQDIGGEEKVISYLSRTLSKAEQNYSTTEKECLAVVWSMLKLRPYLYGRHFKIVTDHHALCWLKNLKDSTGRLARWALKIQEYDFDIIHKSGKKHLDADGLSRGPLPETDWDEDFERLFLNQITDEEDKFIESVKKNLNGSRRSIAQNFKEDGCLFKKNPNPEGRAWLLVVPEKKKREIMKEYHNHMSNGHLGVARTMYRIKSKYFWPSMLKDVSEFVKTCHLCQSRKGSNQLPSGLLQPIPPANFPFERIGIDFVGPLPSTKNRKKWIIVLTDYYTRYAETRAVSEATVKEVSKFLVEDIFLRHGAPQYLISDRGSQFTSNLMKEVMKTCKIKHCFTTSYHPQTNGLTERLNRTLINMLSMYVNTDQKNWDEILPFITHAYNTTIQETTGYSPFFLMFGREPTSLLDDRNISVDIDKDDYDEYIKHHLDKINRTRKLVINNTIKTQERMKKNYDKKHMERSYEPGELVAVWTPIRKIGKCEKLLRKYFGPYRILKKLSNVNYLIEPKDNPGQDPLIVHVSRIKPYFERIDEVNHEDVTTSGEGEVTSEKIQKQRAKERREQYRQVRAHVRREDGRVQAYGWSLPSAPQPHSVPAPVYCRPLVEKDPGLKIWCAAGINLTGGNTKDGGAMVGASVFYSNPPPQPEQLPPDVSEVDKLERELQLGVDAGEGPEEEGAGAPGTRAEFLRVDLCLHPRQQCGDSGGRQQSRGCARHLPCVCLPPPGHSFYPWYGTLVVAQAEGTDEPDGAEEERERFRQWVVVKDPPELVKDGVNAIPRHNPLALSQMEKISSVLPTMWLGAQNGKLYVHSSVAQWFRCIDSVQLPDAILTIVHIRGRVFVSLANGSVAIFHRSSGGGVTDGQWDLGNYHLLDLGQPNHSIRCMAVVHDKIWCGITNHVHIIDAKTLTVEVPISRRCAVQAGFVAHPRKESQVRLLAWAGDGVWLSLRLDSTLRLFHAHTHQHLQDLDLEPCVTRMLGTGQLGFSFVRITSLLISSSRLWIGTGNGVIISVPLSDSKLATGSSSLCPSLTKRRRKGSQETKPPPGCGFTQTARRLSLPAVTSPTWTSPRPSSPSTDTGTPSSSLLLYQVLTHIQVAMET